MHPSKIILYTYIGLLLQGLLVAEQYAKYCRINADDVGQNLSTVPPNLVRIHPHTPSHIGCDSSVWLLERTTPRETAEIHLNPQIPFFSHNFWKQHQKRHVMWQFINHILYTYIDWSIRLSYIQGIFSKQKNCTSNKLLIGTCKMCVCVSTRSSAVTTSFWSATDGEPNFAPVDAESVKLPSLGNRPSMNVHEHPTWQTNNKIIHVGSFGMYLLKIKQLCWHLRPPLSKMCIAGESSLFIFSEIPGSAQLSWPTNLG